MAGVFGEGVDDDWLLTSRETNSRSNKKIYKMIVWSYYKPSIGSWPKAKAAYGSLNDEFPVDASDGGRVVVPEANPVARRGATP